LRKGIRCEDGLAVWFGGLVEELIGKKKLNRFEVIALGKLLQDVYTGID